MLKTRVEETDHGITGHLNVTMYDEMMKSHRDRGWLSTGEMITFGIDHGHALEIGPGPGYLGLEWLKKTKDTRLTALDISPDMLELSRKNAGHYGLESRIEYVLKDGKYINFDDNTFDAVFSSGSLHEWASPAAVFNHIYRILKPGGKFFISDLKRDLNWFVRQFMHLTVKPRAIRPGLTSSINAAYTQGELYVLIKQTHITNFQIKNGLFGIDIMGQK